MSETNQTNQTAQTMEMCTGVGQIYQELQELKDLFRRRLLDDRVKAAAMGQLSEDNQRLNKTIQDMQFISMIKEMILVCDRIESNKDADDFAWSIRDELLEIMNRREVKPIADAVNFDPAIHNAVRVVAPEEGQTSGQIVYTQRTGYTHGNKILRPADVVVAKEL